MEFHSLEEIGVSSMMQMGSDVGRCRYPQSFDFISLVVFLSASSFTIKTMSISHDNLMVPVVGH